VKRRDVLCNGSVYKDKLENVLGAVVVARVITEQKRVEKELTKAWVSAELSTAIALDTAAHKMLPSFSIMGIHADFESIAKKVQEYARAQEKQKEIHGLVLQIEHVCMQACRELQEEFNTLKNKNS
jgi:hypothetical protein